MKLYNYKSPMSGGAGAVLKSMQTEFSKGENSYSKNIFDICELMISRAGGSTGIFNMASSFLFREIMHIDYRLSGMNVFYIDNEMKEYLDGLDITAIDGIEIRLPRHTCSWNFDGINILSQLTTSNTRELILQKIGNKRVKLSQFIKLMPNMDDCLITSGDYKDYSPFGLYKRSVIPKYDILGDDWEVYNNYRVYNRNIKKIKLDAYDPNYYASLIFKASFVAQCCPDLIDAPVYQDDNYKKQGKGVIRFNLKNKSKSKVDHLVSEHIRYLSNERYRRVDKSGKLLERGEIGIIREVKVKSHVRGESTCKQINAGA